MKILKIISMEKKNQVKIFKENNIKIENYYKINKFKTLKLKHLKEVMIATIKLCTINNN